ncbi:MAG TPA: hypothetical protein VNS09_06315 [Solirubrobacter sp.]|nr:hypothetical protein [Solirubrobacter sp.]
MATTIAWATGSCTAVLEISTMSSERRSRTVQHDVLHGPAAYTVYPAAPAMLKLEAHLPDSDDAGDLEAALAAGLLISLSDAAQPDLPPTVRLTGAVSKTLDPETAAEWIITAEVTA